MTWRLAKSLQRLLLEVNTMAPRRSKSSDGTIGDTAHSSRTSDHNPNPQGVVQALDITNDPLNGVISHGIAEALKQSKDKRIKYLISNRMIWNPSVSSEWRPYTGPNPHTLHVHVSVKDEAALYDDESDWKAIGDFVGPVVADPSAPPVKPTLRVGSTDMVHVEELWKELRESEKGFGPILEAAVRAYQKKKGLGVDGVVGPYTWASLKGE